MYYLSLDFKNQMPRADVMVTPSIEGQMQQMLGKVAKGKVSVFIRFAYIVQTKINSNNECPYKSYNQGHF